MSFWTSNLSVAVALQTIRLGFPSNAHFKLVSVALVQLRSIQRLLDFLPVKVFGKTNLLGIFLRLVSTRLKTAHVHVSKEGVLVRVE